MNSYPKSPRIEDKKLLADIRKNPCVVCGGFPTEVDHIKTRGSGGDDSIENCWAVCRIHHIQKGAGLTSFVEKHPRAKTALIARGWHFDEFLKKWVRP